MPSDEMLDIWNEKMLKTGTASRRDAHMLGLWHRTFQCWVLQESPSDGWRLLFQLRHPEKDTYPNLLDISCAGHLLADETVQDGLRELKEELGIEADFKDLYSCGIFKSESYPSPTLTDREFCHVFLLESQAPLADYEFQQSEISGLFYIGLKDFGELLNGNRTSVMADGILLDTGAKAEVRQEVFLQDIVPHSKDYYLFILDRANTWIEERGREK